MSNKGGRPVLVEEATTITATVSRRQKDAVQQMAAIQGVSLSECVRWMIDRFLLDADGKEGEIDGGK